MDDSDHKDHDHHDHHDHHDTQNGKDSPFDDDLIVDEDLTPTPYPEREGYTYGESDEGLEEKALFSGDYGSYPLATRRLLAKLLKGPYIDGYEQADLYSTLLNEEGLVRKWLGEIFLELVLDRDQKIAFTRQQDTFEFKVPMLMRRHKLQFLESVLILFLRQRHSQYTKKGERPVVSAKDILSFLEGFNTRKSNDPARFQRQVTTAMFKFVSKYKLLKKFPGTGERYEISPILNLIFQIEDINALKGVYGEIMEKIGMPLEEEDMESEEARVTIEDDLLEEDSFVETEFFEEEEEPEGEDGNIVSTEFYTPDDEDDDDDDDDDPDF
jgi:hypothetical protein